MRRRDFLRGLGGAAAWPALARAQQSDRLRRIGVLVSLSQDSPETQARLAAFKHALQDLGWTEGRNIHIEFRASTGDAERTRQYAAELIALEPDVVLAGNTSTVRPLQQASRTVPIVFAGVVDPVASGFIDSLSHPGGNTTGFVQFEYSMSSKWLELLKEIAPHVTRAAMLRLRDVSNAEAGEFAAIQAVAPSLGVTVTPFAMGTADEIERGIAAFAGTANSALIVSSGASPVLHRQLIIALAAKHHLPAVYPYLFYVTAGGLISYGPDRIDPYRRAASYVDRILKGEKPGDLPVQAPTKYELAVNLRTAKALGLTVPPLLIARADQVIE